MSRFAWILVFVWCAALGRVQPVEPLATKADHECCGCAGACGQPDCAIAPAPTQPPAELEQPTAVSRPSTPGTLLRPDFHAAAYFLRFSPAAATTVDPPAPPTSVPSPASAPLFMRHCSLLI